MQRKEMWSVRWWYSQLHQQTWKIELLCHRPIKGCFLKLWNGDQYWSHKHVDGAYSFFINLWITEGEKKYVAVWKKSKKTQFMFGTTWLSEFNCILICDWAFWVPTVHHFSLFSSYGYHWTGFVFPSCSKQSKACSLSLANQRNLLARLATE